MSSIGSAVYRVKRSLRGCRPRLSLGLKLFDEVGYCLDLFGFLIALPFLDRWAYEPEGIMESWGFSYFDKALMLTWGSKTKFIHMPWSFDFVKWEVMQPDGKFVLRDASYSDPQDGRWVGSYSYKYLLKSGQIQERTATIYVRRGYWHWLLAKWLHLPLWVPVVNMMRQAIDVTFNDEVGERTGSWKGGTIGCGYDMLPGETAEETLRRMELEREFD